MKKLLMIIISIVWAVPMLAGDFNPGNPPDPNTKYKVQTSATMNGYTSGGGSYLAGTQVNISTSAASTNYTFSHWTKNGEHYCDTRSFTYTVEPQTTSFVAVYEYSPVNPSDPAASNAYRLYLTNNIAEACSFNRTSGTKAEADTWVTVTATKSSAYDFLGWYNGGVKISDALSFSYLMPFESTTLEARFKYNPVNPGDPDSQNGGDVAQTILGDVNGDGDVTVADAVAVINHYLHWTAPSDEDKKYDVNKDGSVTVADAVEVLNIYLNKQ